MNDRWAITWTDEEYKAVCSALANAEMRIAKLTKALRTVHEKCTHYKCVRDTSTGYIIHFTECAMAKLLANTKQRGTPAPEWPSDEVRKQRGFGRAHLLVYLRDWAADSAEREGWHDSDESTYRFRRRTLEAAIAEIGTPAPDLDAIEARVDEMLSSVGPIPGQESSDARYGIEKGVRECRLAARAAFKELRGTPAERPTRDEYRQECMAWRDAHKDYGAPFGDTGSSRESSREALSRARAERTNIAARLGAENERREAAAGAVKQ